MPETLTFCTSLIILPHMKSSGNSVSYVFKIPWIWPLLTMTHASTLCYSFNRLLLPVYVQDTSCSSSFQNDPATPGFPIMTAKESPSSRTYFICPSFISLSSPLTIFSALRILVLLLFFQFSEHTPQFFTLADFPSIGSTILQSLPNRTFSVKTFFFCSVTHLSIFFPCLIYLQSSFVF